MYREKFSTAFSYAMWADGRALPRNLDGTGFRYPFEANIGNKAPSYLQILPNL